MVLRESVGVLITYFDEGTLLRECLESLAAQRDRVDEVLIYDDGSNSPAKDYVPQGFPVKIIRSEVNQGPARGRNVLLYESRSDYIHFHDADDLFSPDWCGRVRQVIQTTEADLIFTEISSFNEEKGLLCREGLGLKKIQSGEDLVRFCIRGAILPCAGTYRRDRVLAIGGYRDSLWQSEDYDFHIRLSAQRSSYAVITEPLVQLRVRSNSRSQKRVEVWSCAVEAIKLLTQELPSKYFNDLGNAAVRFGSMLFRLGAYQEARKAFKLANEIGSSVFSEQRRFYRFMAKTLGPEMAERIGFLYRNLLSQKLRSYLAKRGW